MSEEREREAELKYYVLNFLISDGYPSFSASFAAE